MPSCTNNSTISGILVSTDEAINGKRLAFKQDISINWESGISAGDVIRFDVDNKTFSKSIANPYHNGSLDLSLAEVVGIVEKIEQESGVTYATVITHGLMNYPNLDAIISGISSSSGEFGGTDVFFLSPTVLGGITFEIENGNRYIAKPILQVCPTTEGYNSIVINYLGYETGESASAALVTSETQVGELRLIPTDSVIPEGWVDASSGEFLPINEYASAYAIFSTKYGAKEKIYVNTDSSFVSSLLNKNIRPLRSGKVVGNGTFSTVTEVDTVNNTITVQHVGISDKTFWQNPNYIYEISQNISGTNKLQTVNGEITHFKLPKIDTNVTVNTEQEFNKYRTIIRVKPDSRVSYLPTSIKFNDITVTGTLGTENINDIDSKILELQTRIQVLENKFGI